MIPTILMPSFLFPSFMMIARLERMLENPRSRDPRAHLDLTL